MEKEHVYEQTYNDYLARIADLDFKFAADKLDLQLNGEEIAISFFGSPYRISTKGIKSKTGEKPHLSGDCRRSELIPFMSCSVNRFGLPRPSSSRSPANPFALNRRIQY